MVMQEYFEFGFDDSLKDNDFIVSQSNMQAVSLIENWPDWQSNIILIYGPKACGKSHIASIWQRKSNAKYISANDIYQNNYTPSDHYILDDIENIHDEAAFFHFFNSIRENKGFLLMTAKAHPSQSSIRLADLRSRLNSIISESISIPDDELLQKLFLKQFADRQLRVDIEVINYIINRMERSFENLYRLVDLLDKKALQDKKNITIPFVKTVL